MSCIKMENEIPIETESNSRLSKFDGFHVDFELIKAFTILD